ncbi:MAG: hypothetical protein IPO44_12425 [Candidatus Microthrix sp.]|nr:wax ester/triacylglycerol synthase domain-containing protein [Candidatus Microthrix sp.]MBK9560318.1 hypothetical protein [Candidatus Microthrix sp.]
MFHHVLADGIGGLAVLAGLVDGAEETPEREFPRPAPATSRLALDALRSRVRGLSRLPRAPARVGAAVKELRATGGTQAARCSLNRPTGPDRRLAVATVELAAVVDVAHDYGGSVNDVVLSAIDGALLTLLAGRGEQVQRLVVSIPVSAGRRRPPPNWEIRWGSPRWNCRRSPIVSNGFGSSSPGEP